MISISGGGHPPCILVYSREDGDWHVEHDKRWASPLDNCDTLAWNSNGSRLFIGCPARSLIVDPATLKVTCEFPFSGMTQGAWLRDRNVIAFIRGQECVLFDVDAQQVAGRFGVGPACSLQLSPNGELLATGGQDGFVRIYSVADWSLFSAYEAHEGAVSATSWSPDSGSVASSGQDGRIHLWPVVKNKAEFTVAKLPCRSPFLWTAGQRDPGL